MSSVVRRKEKYTHIQPVTKNSNNNFSAVCVLVAYRPTLRNHIFLNTKHLAGKNEPSSSAEYYKKDSL